MRSLGPRSVRVPIVSGLSLMGMKIYTVEARRMPRYFRVSYHQKWPRTRYYLAVSQCTHYVQRGFGAHLVHRGADRGIPRLLCTRCEGTFSARQGTAYFGVRAEEPNYTIAMRALAEGNSLRGTGRIVAIDKDTVCDWLDRAGRHCRAVTTYLFDTLHITECQVDELWSFVRKKEAHLTAAEKVLAL